jgi:hypothetical protein
MRGGWDRPGEQERKTQKTLGGAMVVDLLFHQQHRRLGFRGICILIDDM